MFSTIYTALSGMLGFSKGLDVISNNIANLNTPGFKSSELEFRDLFYRYTQGGGSDQEGERSQIGAGLDTKGTRTAFREGEMQDSGNPLDIAIDGWLVDEQDKAAADAPELAGITVRAVPLYMSSPAATAAIARATLDLALELRG